MSDIQRWKCTTGGTVFGVDADPCDTGKWVKYDDHTAALAAKDAEIERLKQSVKRSEALELRALRERDALREAMRVLGALVKFYDEAWDDVLMWDASNTNTEPYQLRMATLEQKIQANPLARAAVEGAT